MSRGKKILGMLKDFKPETDSVFGEQEREKLHVVKMKSNLAQDFTDSYQESPNAIASTVNIVSSSIYPNDEYEKHTRETADSDDEDSVIPPSVSSDGSYSEHRGINWPPDTDEEVFSSDHSEYIPEDSYESSNSLSDSLELTENSPSTSSTRKPHENSYKNSDSHFNCSSTNPVNSHSSEVSYEKHKKKNWVPVKRLPDLCYFCEEEVLNFGRHLLRNHSQETEVQKIITLKPSDLSRRRLIAAIRKRGNHLKNVNACVKPVKRSHIPGTDVSHCIPCKYCLGYFRPKQLWRHVKNCPHNPGGRTKYSHKTDAQDLLVYHPVDQRLKETVFPTVRADKVSLVAKQDTLICKYGAQYFTSHREKHHINVCSRKMRELAKILIEVRKLCPAVENMYDALQPVYFDSFIEATKIIAGYDPTKEEYQSSTFAMNISTSLKECCSLAIRITLKRKSYNSTLDTAQLEANFNTFQQLLKDSWKFEVSSVAASCLNTKRWNKVTIVSLASDLKVFRCYRLEKANLAQELLNSDSTNVKAYKLLLEVTYCRSMLLNRKRGGELQRMPLDLYLKAQIHQSYEEFNDAISPTERVLLKKFKRVVIRGKRDRGVPVLFSIDVQQHLNVLITLRDRFVNKANIYLFPKLQHETPITGYKVMQKHAALSRAKNPGAITSTRLRKHLATMSQILELSPNDVEQLATFMGHIKDIHKQVYRLPDDVYQTAKIAKLLVLMESGKAGEYKGKSLDEIEIDLEEEIVEDESDEEPTNEETLQQKPLSTTQSSKKYKRKLVPWTTDQKKLTTWFKNHILNKKPPKKDECTNLKLAHPKIFENKTWQQIKVFVQNIYSKK